MEFREFAKWIEEIRDRAMHEESEEGDKSLHYMQNSINLLQVAGLWITYGVQEKSYAAQRAAEKWTKRITVLTAVLVFFTIVLAVLTARLAL
jgi:hypothetical protein